MKIMWHSNAPWVHSGYGSQTAIWAPRLAELGHDVAISAFHGLEGGRIDWNGIPVYPKGDHPYGGDVIGMHARHFEADLVITLMDHWALPHETIENYPTAAWMPIDCKPLSIMEEDRLKQSGARPIAMSRFGERQLKNSGYDSCLYIPHGIDTSVFIPPLDREALRKAMGVDERFVILIVAANVDKFGRKGWSQQFEAFTRFNKRHPDALLVCHTRSDSPFGLNLQLMAERMGCAHAVVFNSQYLLAAGLVDPEMLRGTYGMADVFSNCSFGEGFGIPVLESLSCGVPAVVTRGSAMIEVVGPAGWKVATEPYWPGGHQARWQQPLIASIVRAYEKAYERGPEYRTKVRGARPHALQYDVKNVLEQFWVPALAELEQWAHARGRGGL